MGDFSLRKGVRDLIAAIPRVAEHVPSARFVLCGSDHNGDIHGAVRIAGVEDFVEMPGFVSGQDKLEWLQRASVFVLPSYAEGMPVAILEAMAVGLPIVTTPVGATPDVVEDGVNGFLIEPGDVSQLAARLIQLLQDENLRREMGQRNREKVLAEYDISVFVDRLSQVYEELAAC
jgi:glycosyltransferase involved in cell wall biosynthesis